MLLATWDHLLVLVAVAAQLAARLRTDLTVHADPSPTLELLDPRRGLRTEVTVDADQLTAPHRDVVPVGGEVGAQELLQPPNLITLGTLPQDGGVCRRS